MPKATILGNVPVLFIREGAVFICYTPAFDLAAHGDSIEDALKSFQKSLKLFIEEVTKMGTWPQVLKEYGWKKVHNKLLPPQIIGQTVQPIRIPATV